MPILSLWLGLCVVFAAGMPHSAEAGSLDRKTDRCIVRATIEANGQARVDMTRKPGVRNCGMTEKETVSLLADILTAPPKSGGKMKPRTVLIGKIRDYAWLQRHLIETARTDPAWSRKTRRPRSGHANSYVNEVLGAPVVADIFNHAGHPAGLVYSSADCEKIFVSKDGLPVSGTCWLTFVSR